jgi:hypothetical protein
MRRTLGAALVTMLAFGIALGARAGDNKDAAAIIDKGIKALGGADKLGKAKAFTWKGKNKITFGDKENEFSTVVTVDGLDRMRQESEGEFGGQSFKVIVVLNDKKGWRSFGGNNMEMDEPGVANQKRTLYLQAAATTLLPLKEKGFKCETAGEEKVNDKPAAVLKVTGPDGKDFKLYFDKESGLPVKQVAKVAGFKGDEFTQETIFSDYKDFGGIKKATKVVNLRDGEKFMQFQVADFSVLEKVDPKLFAEPK